MKRFAIVSGYALIVAVCTAGEKTQVAVDQLSQDAIQSAFQVLRRDYIRKDDLTFDQLNRAALQGVLSRLSFGAELVREKDERKVLQGSVVAEQLTERIAVLRPLTLTVADVPLMEKPLLDWTDKGVRHLILDLRQPVESGMLDAAAAMAELFIPRGELLFKLRQLGAQEARLFISNRSPAWQGDMLILVDSESSNVAETLAAILRQKRRGLVIGSATRGATVGFDEVPLEKGWHLRFARAEVLLADDTSVYKSGLKPDFEVPFSPETKKRVFQSALTGSVKNSIFEKARERYNERALVAGKNPELDDYIQRSSGRTLSYDDPPPRDKVLQRALDLLVAREMKQP